MPQVHFKNRADLMLPSVGPTGLAIALGIAYFLAAHLSLAFLGKPDGVAVFWLAAGVSSGVLIASGPAARLPVASGVIIATIIANLMGDRTVWNAAASALWNTGEALLVAWLVELYFGSDFTLGRLRNVFGLVAAAVLAAAASGIGGAVAFHLFHSPTAPVWTIWQHWVVSDATGIIVVAPLVIGLAEALRKPPPRSKIIEGTAALVVLVATIVVVILLPFEPWQAFRPTVLLFPVLLWLAARCGPVFAAAGAFVVSLMIVWTTTFGIGQFGDPTFPVGIVDPTFPIGSRILGAQIAIAVCTFTADVLAALFAERRQAEEHQDLLIAELDHRVKNVLARVVAVVRHTSPNSGTVEEFIQSVEGRIQSMAGAHALLSQSRWHGVGLIDLLRRQLAPYTTDANVSFDGPDVILTSRETQALAMVIHELVTNAVKYGALSRPDGSVPISWNCTGGDPALLRILWLEVCGPPVLASVQSGYGSNLIRDLISYELGGTVELTFPRDGVRCKIEIPIKRRYVPSTR